MDEYKRWRNCQEPGITMFVTTTCLGWVPVFRTEEGKAILLSHLVHECRRLFGGFDGTAGGKGTGQWKVCLECSEKVRSFYGGRCPIPPVMHSGPTIPFQRAEHTESDLALLYSFLDACPEAMWLRDEEGMHVYVNEKARSMGVQPGDHLQIMRSRGYSPDAIADAAADDKFVFHSCKPLVKTVVVTDPSGQTKTLLVTKFPIYDANRRMLVGGIAVDLTQFVAKLQAPESGRAAA